MFDMDKKMRVKGADRENFEAAREVAHIIQKALADRFEKEIERSLKTGEPTSAKEVSAVVCGAMMVAAKAVAASLPIERGIEFVMSMLATAYGADIKAVDSDKLDQVLPELEKRLKKTGFMSPSDEARRNFGFLGDHKEDKNTLH